MNGLSLVLADAEGLVWAQEQVALHHYLHQPVDARCRPLAYLVQFCGEPMGCLIFGRPESTRCLGWYGSVEDVENGRCPLTRWQILNLARVWLHADLQTGGRHYTPNAASWAIGQSLSRVGFDYLMCRPVVWLDEPYEIHECLSYCDPRIHRGSLYRACNFTLKRTNDRGLQTYVRTLRRLTHAEHQEIARASQADKRARRLREARLYQQPELFEEVAV